MQAFHVIDFSAIHIKEALLVDEDFQTIELEDLVTLIVEILVEAHPILKAGATAAHHLDTQADIWFRLFREDLLNLIFGFLR